MNIPNKITLSRILLMPVFLFFYLSSFIPYGKLVALFIFFIAILTDFVDGFIARKYNLVTDLGIFLDPIADKLLASIGAVVLIVDKVIPTPYGIIFIFIMLLRDYFVTGLRQIAQLKKVIISADKWAKIKAISLYFTLMLGLYLSFLYTLNTSTNVYVRTFEIIFYVFLAITTILIINSGLVYTIKNAHVFKVKGKNKIATLDKLDDEEQV